MLLKLLLFILLPLSTAVASENILQQAVEQFQNLKGYSTTLRSYGTSGQIINYSYQKPGYVRMDFIKPHNGAVLVYRPDTGKVQLRPFGFIKSLTLTLEPTAKLVRSPAGHRVDESDIGVLLERAQELARRGSMQVLREELLQQTTVIVLEITGEENVLVDGVHRYVLWIDKKLYLPRQVESYDNDNQLIEGLSLEDLIINPSFAGFFTL